MTAFCPHWRSARTRDDPGGRRRHCVGTGPATPRVARSPVRPEQAVHRLLMRLSAPLFRRRSRRLFLLQHQPFEITRDASVVRFRPRFQQRLELGRHREIDRFRLTEISHVPPVA